jgi:hypothetical protein
MTNGALARRVLTRLANIADSDLHDDIKSAARALRATITDSNTLITPDVSAAMTMLAKSVSTLPAEGKRAFGALLPLAG